MDDHTRHASGLTTAAAAEEAASCDRIAARIRTTLNDTPSGDGLNMSREALGYYEARGTACRRRAATPPEASSAITRSRPQHSPQS